MKRADVERGSKWLRGKSKDGRGERQQGDGESTTAAK